MGDKYSSNLLIRTMQLQVRGSMACKFGWDPWAGECKQGVMPVECERDVPLEQKLHSFELDLDGP